MAISYPRAMLAGCQATDTMRLIRTEAAAMLASGATQATQLAPPRWRCDYTTKPLSMAERRPWRAWLDSLNGALRTFLGHSPLQVWPGAYPGGFAGMSRASGGAFDGTAQASAVSATGISIIGLPAGFVLGAGDLLGLVQNGKYGLYRIMEPVVAAGNGTASVTLSPAVNTSLFSIGATVNFARPVCEMILDPATAPDASAELSRKPVTFTGIQRLY